MSRRAHIVVQFLLLVLWVVVVLADNVRLVRSQDCFSAPYPDYLYKNPLRNFWNPNLGSVTVKIDQMFTTQYPAVPDAAERIEVGHREWNNQDICAPSLHFTDFGLKTFTETEKSSPPPTGKVYWIVKDPQSGSYAGIQSVFISNRVVAARVMVHPGGSWTQLSIPYTFNHLGSHEIGHEFNLNHCTGVCTPNSIMGGATFGPNDAIGPGPCDIEKVKALYCPTPCEEWCDFAECSGACIPADPCTYPSGGCPSGYSRPTRDSGCCAPSNSPILVDVNGNGFKLSSAENGVVFDLDGNGTSRQFAWTSTSSDDAWLALDRNGNGPIDNGTELFGNFTPQPSPPEGQEKNGFLALAEYDKTANGGNNDGRITSVDSIFPSLRLWQDVNHNGISEASELKPLNVLGLSSIELDYKMSQKTDEYGNAFRYRVKVIDFQGRQMGRWAWDVFLVSAP